MPAAVRRIEARGQIVEGDLNNLVGVIGTDYDNAPTTDNIPSPNEEVDQAFSEWAMGP